MRRVKQPFHFQFGWLIFAIGLALAAGLWGLSGRAVSMEPPSQPEAIDLREVSLDEALPAGPQSGLPEVDVSIDGKRYRVEVASTPEQSRIGLMYRTGLPDRHGMLFTFNPAQTVNFWMKNTKIPLDIVFLDQGKVVHVVQNAQPCLNGSCPVYGSTVPVDQVVELKAGTAEKNRITSGSLMSIDPKQSDAVVLLKRAPKTGR